MLRALYRETEARMAPQGTEKDGSCSPSKTFRMPNASTRIWNGDKVTRHGVPKKLISDRSTTFRSGALRTYLQLARVEHHFASAYQPHAYGLTERSNQTIPVRPALHCKNNKPGVAD